MRQRRCKEGHIHNQKVSRWFTSIPNKIIITTTTTTITIIIIIIFFFIFIFIIIIINIIIIIIIIIILSENCHLISHLIFTFQNDYEWFDPTATTLTTPSFDTFMYVVLVLEALQPQQDLNLCIPPAAWHYASNGPVELVGYPHPAGEVIYQHF